MSVEIKPCNWLYYDVILTFYAINRPGAYFCMSLSICTDTAYLSDQVCMQKHNPEVFCHIARHFVLSNCSSKFSVGRDLYMYLMLHNGNKIMRENRNGVPYCCYLKKIFSFKCVFYIYVLTEDSKTI